MNKDQVKGTATDIAGKVQKNLGDAKEAAKDFSRR